MTDPGRSGAGDAGGGGFLRQGVFGGKLWTLAVAIVVMVGVAAGAVAIVATRSSSNSPAATHKTAAASGCQLASEVSDVIPTSAPPSTTWINLRGFQLPVSSAGPAQHGPDGDWTCYAHSPTGALETVIGLFAGGLTGNVNAVKALLSPGSVSATDLAALVPAGGAQRQPGVAIVGFTFGTFSRQGGSVSVVDSCTISSCVSPLYQVLYNLTWNGTWQITNGGGATTPLSSAAGVTTWEAPA